MTWICFHTLQKISAPELVRTIKSSNAFWIKADKLIEILAFDSKRIFVQECSGRDFWYLRVYYQPSFCVQYLEDMRTHCQSMCGVKFASTFQNTSNVWLIYANVFFEINCENFPPAPYPKYCHAKNEILFGNHKGWWVWLRI